MIKLKKLRKNLTIIPQDPSLMEGSLRYNIDPINAFTDKDIINNNINEGEEINENNSIKHKEKRKLYKSK